MSPETLQAYSAGLEGFDPQDVKAAVGQLILVPRREGETAFPEFATLRMAVRGVEGDRRAAERTQDVLRQAEHRAKHPEEYVDINPAVRELLEKRKMA